MCTIKIALVKCALFKILMNCGLLVSPESEVLGLIAIVKEFEKLNLQIIKLNVRIVEE